MRLWEQTSIDKCHRRLHPIGQTRWWAKDTALRNPDRSLYVDMVLTLLVMQSDQTMRATTRAKGKGYIECLLKFETVLTVQIFLNFLNRPHHCQNIFKSVEWTS
ncbi:Uncharacterized protein FKW44_010915 [Caligus rogercresseyi]|uniref:Uncharacterized protein n=1 Tax=Caligus rogercresseyi TaxID=217165 RepID=A0A7T8HHN4_CALRO|nr:Uncharacterized protein FKW44_010915 [Caligus rogercresseyi]